MEVHDKEFTLPQGLKPCPFCGSEVGVFTLFHPKRQHPAAWTARVFCRTCLLTLPSNGFCLSKEDAIRCIVNSWNNRFHQTENGLVKLDTTLTPNQSTALFTVKNALIDDAIHGVMPENMEHLRLDLQLHKDAATAEDPESLVRLAAVCIHGVMLHQAEALTTPPQSLTSKQGT